MQTSFGDGGGNGNGNGDTETPGSSQGSET